VEIVEEMKNGWDALRDDLQDASTAFGQFQTMAVSDSGEHGFNQPARSQEGGAV
jgi:hypothetical protein